MKNDRTGPTRVYEAELPLKSTALTTIELSESAGEPIRIFFL